ncbi:MAG TPA: formylglycine-generating enzyme family protein [Longimicrobium sp.]
MRRPLQTTRLVWLPGPPVDRRPPGPPPEPGMVWIPGGSFRMGSNDFYPEEAPVHRVVVRGFWIDRHPVTNARFNRFVAATGYLTVAERTPDPADYPGALPERLVPGSLVFLPPPDRAELRNPVDWWTWVPGASWQRPAGPGSSLSGLERHPVVHLAWEDVAAYARWARKEIPTEAEWEFAARGGLDGRAYAWGDELAPGGRAMANVWRDGFASARAAGRRWERTSPVGAFPPNGYGLYDVIGNVWEWTADWWRWHAGAKGPCCTGVVPSGADRKASVDLDTPDLRFPRKVLKGGSYLCAPDYCARYRPAARIPQRVGTATGHVGFRCVVRVPAERGGAAPPQ